MKVLVTGANGFIGKNLIAELKQREEVEILAYDLDTPEELLDQYCGECNFIFNLAGVNRPKDPKEFAEGNCGFVGVLTEALRRHGNTCPIMISSSIHAAGGFPCGGKGQAGENSLSSHEESKQAGADIRNAYGESKKAGEELLLAYGREAGAAVYIYRFPGVFGKWCRPNYNSVVATFCHNIANDLPIRVDDENKKLSLVYIDDVVEELLQALDGHPHMGVDGYYAVPTVHEVTLGEIVRLLYSFKESRRNLLIPDMTEGSFEKKLYSTYLSYLPEGGFSYPLTTHADERGSFTEVLKSADRGQVSVNVAKPGVTKGNHWHHTKNEKFLVVSGKGLICFRKYGCGEITEYPVSGEKPEIVDIPPGYAHSITNVGDTDLVTLMWCNECYDENCPDTMREDVEGKEKD